MPKPEHAVPTLEINWESYFDHLHKIFILRRLTSVCIRKFVFGLRQALTNERYSLMVNENITVGHLKEMLHAKFGIDVDNKRL